MTHWTGAWHPLTERFPTLDGDGLGALAADIRRHGQAAPCRMDPGGLGLDGRSRVAACALAGVEPRWEVYDGDPVAFVVEANAEERNLGTGQRAMAVAIGLVEAGLRSNGRFRRGSVPEHPPELTRASWRDKVALAGFVLDHAPELGDRVLAGELGLDTRNRRAAGVGDVAGERGPAAGVARRVQPTRHGRVPGACRRWDRSGIPTCRHGGRLPRSRGAAYLRRDFLGAFPDYNLDVEELRDLGDVTLGHMRGSGHGADSATPLVDPFWIPMRWRDGKLVWWRNCSTEAEALEAARLRE